jgi:hypothetical protein
MPAGRPRSPPSLHYGAGMPRNAVALRLGWICLSVVGVGILGFGLVAACFSSDPLVRADGVALTGFGLFGILVTVIPFRRRERWAWLLLWFYPVFWLAHLLGRLPPGKDHVHQILFIVLSLAGLLVTGRVFWPADLTAASQPGQQTLTNPRQ